MSHTLATIVILIAVGSITLTINLTMRRKGYSIPGKAVVRCRKGHLFRTTWIEGGSLKAIRLGPLLRYQHCPIGKHWALVRPVKEQDLTSADRKLLEEN